MNVAGYPGDPVEPEVAVHVPPSETANPLSLYEDEVLVVDLSKEKLTD